MTRRSIVFALFVSTLTGCTPGGAKKDGDAGGPVATADPAAAAAAASASAAAAAAAASAAAAANSASAKVAAKNAGAIMIGGTKMPTCAKGESVGSYALSPLSPFCGGPCKADADCHGKGACREVNLLVTPEHTQPKDQQFVKLCDPSFKAGPSTGPSSSASARGATPAPKCGPNQHYDDINKKCRANGDCPKGYRWNEPMQSCIDDGG